jgi:DNA polymerase (family 10)
MLLPQALEITESLAEAIRAHGPADVLVQAAGSARRGADTVKDIDLVAITADPVGLSAAIAGLAPIASVVSAGPVGAKAVTHSGANVDLRIGSPEQHGNLLQHFTGSAHHNAALRERAVRMGMHVSEYAISTDATGGRHHYATEEAVYAAMGLAFIAPELREDRGEIHAATGGAGGLPTLVERSDIRGDLHSHTLASDGRASIEDMAAAARALGYEYLAITDHSASHGFGNAVSADQLRRQIERIREIDDALTGITVLAGSEVNVATDGSLDYPDQLLGELDWVIASVHTAFSMSAEAMTARMVAAIEHPLVDAIGHPTGRLLGRRAPYDLDLETVFAAAAKTATMLEINANPRRRDLSDSAAAAAARAGVTLVINSDAHGTDTLGNMRWGVLTARRAWLRASDVANTRPWAELRSMRGRAGAATGREAARP